MRVALSTVRTLRPRAFSIMGGGAGSEMTSIISLRKSRRRPSQSGPLSPFCRSSWFALLVGFWSRNPTAPLDSGHDSSPKRVPLWTPWDMKELQGVASVEPRASLRATPRLGSYTSWARNLACPGHRARQSLAHEIHHKPVGGLLVAPRTLTEGGEYAGKSTSSRDLVRACAKNCMGLRQGARSRVHHSTQCVEDPGEAKSS
jgi:hypothetical protein